MHQWTTGDAPISIHALREEGDHGRRRQHRDRPISIHALREEGDAAVLVFYELDRISIHALREEGDPGHAGGTTDAEDISIHALREEGDHGCFAQFCILLNFYPRPPRGGRPGSGALAAIAAIFLSTPSARRATFMTRPRKAAWSYFYPRPPRGGRRGEGCLKSSCEVISIHALREEGDCPGH